MQATPPQRPQEPQGWQPYSLDHAAQELVIKHRSQDVLGESHKMRMACSYGLERFWGEHLRFKKEESAKAEYWKAVWKAIAHILATADITLPDAASNVRLDEQKRIEETAKEIWNLHPEDQRVALTVLTQFCDSLVWWTQRYKLDKNDSPSLDANSR